jgi:hypothetical protein
MRIYVYATVEIKSMKFEDVLCYTKINYTYLKS